MESSDILRLLVVYKLYIWDVSGNQQIFGDSFICEYDKPIPDDVIERAYLQIKYFEENKIECSDCGKLTDRNKVGRYFAGSYCDDCWLGRTGKNKGKGGWQAVEARENYN